MALTTTASARGQVSSRCALRSAKCERAGRDDRDDTAERLESAYDRETKALALDPHEREEIRAVLFEGAASGVRAKGSARPIGIGPCEE